MIKARDAIRSAQARIGTPYGTMDCIALIRDVIKRSAGGVPDYRCEGTNWLWKSIGKSGKYKHLIWRQDGLEGARGGMLAFKRNGDDVHHVGIVTGNGTVIHSSSVTGYVVETALDDSWDCLGQHRYIELLAIPDPTPEEPDVTDTNVGDKKKTTLIRTDGCVITLEGAWRVAND